ncbi:MAG: hypothetical protein IJZ08_06025 [Clostridia bacterium]|nr:hypothetical protein [Clostridia bacterium]
MEGIIISDLNQIIKNKDVLGAHGNSDTWFTVDYETDTIRGKMLTALETSHPEPIVLSPELTGWYKIYHARITNDGSMTAYMRFSDEKMPTMIREGFFPRPPRENSFEWVEEQLWCCADLTGRDIVFHKHHKQDYYASIAWLRFVPMTEEEVAAYQAYMNPEGHRNLHVHYDNDCNLWDGSDEVEHAMLKLVQIKNDDVKICTQEIMADNYDGRAITDHTKALGWTAIVYNDENRKAALKQGAIHAARRELIHSYGAKYYAGFRMSLASFSGSSQPLMQEYFCEAHPEFHMLTRDGRQVRICSYAYKEVQDYVIELLVNNVKVHGFDGVSLICHRGQMIGFEQPVLDECARRFDGLDARLLPLGDPRLTEVHCAIMTDFIIRLHENLDKALGRHVPINMIVGYNAEVVGIDCEALAKAGAIDHISQDSLEHTEPSKYHLREDGLIDMEKYKYNLLNNYTVHRPLADSWERAKEAAIRYLAVSEKYGVEFFAGMTTHWYDDPMRYYNWNENLKALGVKNFSFYNHCHFVGLRGVCAIVGKAGREKIEPETYTMNFYRVLKLDGVDISTYLPQWSE